MRRTDNENGWLFYGQQARLTEVWLREKQRLTEFVGNPVVTQRWTFLLSSNQICTYLKGRRENVANLIDALCDFSTLHSVTCVMKIEESALERQVDLRLPDDQLTSLNSRPILSSV